jgi:SAM-dependent methyltransferase
MTTNLSIDTDRLRAEVQDKYREVALHPGALHHFHTGRPLALMLGYDSDFVASLPDRAIESFAGVGNPFSLRAVRTGERVVDIGSGAGFDAFVAARYVGPTGQVTGVDMTAEMLTKARDNAAMLGASNAEFRKGFAESLPVADESSDVVISNGVFNLCPDKRKVFDEVFRVLRPGGVLQFADIANGRTVPPEALREIDLWTG